MCLLTEQQVATVMSDVESVGINYSHLSTDLIDHICCDIESHMDQGISFNDAYKLVKKEFGIKGLRQIQQDTLMLIDKNYRIMKKSMKAIGVAALSLMAFGALFKITHWPGASMILTLSFFFSTLVFFPSLLWIMFKEGNSKKHAVLYLTSFLGGAGFMVGVLFKIMHFPGAHLLIFIGISLLAYLVLPMILVSKLKQDNAKKGMVWLGILPLIVYVSGILFKLNHWPGANILLSIGSIILILVFIPFYYRTEIRKSTKPRVDFLFGIIALTYFVIFSFLLQMNLSRTSHNYNYIQNHSFKQSAAFLEKVNNKRIENLTNKNLSEINKHLNILLSSIEELKIAIVKSNNETDRTTALSLLKTATPLAHPLGNINHLLPHEHPNSPIIELELRMNTFIEFYSKQTNANDKTLVVLKQYKILLDDFNYQHASSALGLLSLFEYQLQIINYSLITSNLTSKN